MRTIFSILLIVVTLVIFSCLSENNASPNKIIFFPDHNESSNLATEVPAVDYERLRTKAREATKYCKQKGMDTASFVLIDMGRHSGTNRFFVWSNKKDTVQYSFLVTHGCGTSIWSSDESAVNPKFSNVPESHLSSLGKYKIGERGVSSWGIGVKYLLHGLEPTNNNALNRYIVLHSWPKVPAEQIYPAGAPESWGCPAIANEHMQTMDSILLASKKPMLMWIFK